MGDKTPDTKYGLLGHHGGEGVREQAVVDARSALIALACPSGGLNGDKAVGNDSHISDIALSDRSQN